MDPAPQREHAIAATERLYRSQLDRVVAVLRRLGLRGVEVEDAAQDVFLVAHRRRGEFEGRAAVTTWLHAIAVRVALARRRKRARRDRLDRVALERPGERADRRADPEDAVALAEADALVRALLERLDPPSRAVFVLAELQGRSVPEIASSLGLNPRTTYSRLRVARERFTRELRRWQHQEDIRVRGREPRRLAATRASRERDEPITPRKRDAIWAALVVRIDEVPTLPAPAPAAIASLSPATWVAAGVGLVCGSALVVGLIRPPEVADKNVQRDRSPAAAVAPEAVAPAVARLELDPGPQRSEVDAPTSTPDAAPRRRRRPTPAPASSPASSPAPTSALSAELALLRRARAAEASGALAVARASLEEHARRFPDGHLAPERERALIRLLCAQGEVAAARARARSFATASHRPLASVLPQGCGPAS